MELDAYMDSNNRIVTDSLFSGTPLWHEALKNGLSVFFHLAGRRRINAFLSSVYGNTETYATAYRHKSGNDSKNQNGIPDKVIIITDKNLYRFVNFHSLLRSAHGGQ